MLHISHIYRMLVSRIATCRVSGNLDFIFRHARVDFL